MRNRGPCNRPLCAFGIGTEGFAECHSMLPPMPLDYGRAVDEVARCQFHSDAATQAMDRRNAPFPTCAEHHCARDERNQSKMGVPRPSVGRGLALDFATA